MRSKRDRVALVLMARAPRVGAVKTRLSPPLSIEQASEMYRAMLLDKLDQIARLESAQTWIAYASHRDETFFKAYAPQGMRLLLQRGKHLGERMYNVVVDLLGDGAAGVVLTGADLPTVDNRTLSLAIEHVSDDTVDLVIGPAVDGGYYLMGMRKPHPALFSGIDWSTNSVLPRTLGLAELGGLRVTLLDQQYDVDDASSLQHVFGDLENNASLAPRTAAFLKAHAAQFGLDKTW